MRVCMLSCFSRVRFFVTLQTIVRQASLSMRILQARILQWVAMPYPGNIPDPEIKSAAPAPRADSLLLSHREVQGLLVQEIYSCTLHFQLYTRQSNKQQQ